MVELKKRKSIPTQELFKKVMDKLDRMEERWKAMEARQTMTEAAWQRQGTLVEEINNRCMAKLGMKCPLTEDEDNGNGNGNGE
jgi:hypothetical protein